MADVASALQEPNEEQASPYSDQNGIIMRNGNRKDRSHMNAPTRHDAHTQN